jgi:hypothetical protein
MGAVERHLQVSFGSDYIRSLAYNNRFSDGPLRGPSLNRSVCARQGTARARGKSSCQGLAEPKARSRARASTVRWGLEEAPSKHAGRRTGTGDEVWHTRDERARDREVLHPQGGAVSIRRLRVERSVSYPGRSAGCPGPRGLRAERFALTDQQKSAEGIVGSTPATLVRHPTAERRGNGEAAPQRGRAEGPNGAPRGAERRGGVATCRAGARQP